MTLSRLFVRPLALVLVTAGLLACSRPEAPSPEAPSMTVAVAHTPEAAASAHAPEAHSLLRLDYTLTTTDPGKAPTTAEYMVNVEENHPGEVHLGRNISLQARPVGSAPSTAAPAAHGPAPLPSASGRPPMSVGFAPRMDIGLLLRCSYQMSGDDFVVHTTLEMSDIIDETAPVASIAKVTLKGDAPVKTGQSIVVSTSEDPNTHRRYQLAVKATRLR